MKLTPEQAKLMEDNYKLIFKATSRYLNKSEHTFDEIHDVCIFSLTRTAIMFDPTKGFKFATLFFTILDNKMRNIYRDKRAIKRRHNGMLSLDKPVVSGEGKDLTISDIIGNHDKYLFEYTNLIRGSRLTDKEARCCELYYLKDLEQREIANIIGCTQAHVSRLIRQGVDKIRDELLEAVK